MQGFYACTDNGWAPFNNGARVTCSPVECQAATPAGSATSSRAEQCPSGEYGELCHPGCRSGSAGSSITPYTCDKRGHWTGGSISCTVPSCPAKPPTANANPCPAGTADSSRPSTCAATCADGYHRDSGDGMYICDPEQGWQPSGTGLRCLDWLCQPATFPPHIDLGSRQLRPVEPGYLAAPLGLGRIVAAHTTARPLYTTFTNILGASVSN